MCEAENQEPYGALSLLLLFEEAHRYVSKNTVHRCRQRIAHLASPVSSSPTWSADSMITVLRQTDNLFLAHLPFDDDVRHIGKSAMTDQKRMSAFVKKLRRHHALLWAT
jgi:hypothetical protein